MRTLIALTAAMLLPLTVNAADDMHMHHNAPAKVAGKAQQNSSVKAYVAAAHKMHRGMNVTYTGNADIDFARGMVPHHQGAVDMVNVLNKYGKDAELKKFAGNIRLWQKTEIGLMQRWLDTHDNHLLKTADNDVVREYKAAMESMHKDMNIRYTGDADRDFVVGMIPHHQGAVDMANILIKYGRDPQLRNLAHDVVRSQQQEIAFMNEWLSKRGKK